MFGQYIFISRCYLAIDAYHDHIGTIHWTMQSATISLVLHSSKTVFFNLLGFAEPLMPSKKFAEPLMPSKKFAEHQG